MLQEGACCTAGRFVVTLPEQALKSLVKPAHTYTHAACTHTGTANILHATGHALPLPPSFSAQA